MSSTKWRPLCPGGDEFWWVFFLFCKYGLVEWNGVRSHLIHAEHMLFVSINVKYMDKKCYVNRITARHLKPIFSHCDVQFGVNVYIHMLWFFDRTFTQTPPLINHS